MGGLEGGMTWWGSLIEVLVEEMERIALVYYKNSVQFRIKRVILRRSKITMGTQN